MAATWPMVRLTKLRRKTTLLSCYASYIPEPGTDVQEVKMAKLRLRGHWGGTDTDAHWVKSSLSYSNGACVEVAGLAGGNVGVRDSKDNRGPVLRFTPDEWHAFLGGVRNGEFDSFGRR